MPGKANTDRIVPRPDVVPSQGDPRPRVWVDQDLCTGDGICAQLAPEVFKIHWDGLAYVHHDDEQILDSPGATVPIDFQRVAEVLESARECPGDCICVLPGPDGTVDGQPSPRVHPGDEIV
ncbi:MAG TPA: ferredoxin [Nitriliruptorales bacterium]